MRIRASALLFLALCISSVLAASIWLVFEPKSDIRGAASAPRIVSLSPRYVTAGATLTLTGQGFLPAENPLGITSVANPAERHALTAASSGDGTEIAITLPKTLRPGAYSVSIGAGSGTTAPAIRLDVVARDVSVEMGPESVFIGAEQFDCDAEGFDIPDFPLRAYRDAQNTVHAFMVNSNNYAFVGKTLDKVARVSCAKMLASSNSPDPSTFTNREWIMSPYTLDGTTVHALVHNEFHGDGAAPYNKECPRAGGRAKVCWYTAMTYAVSTDSGATFKRGTPFLVWAPLLPFSVTMQRFGAFSNSNIIRNPRDNHFYALVNYHETYRPNAPAPPSVQTPGVCVIRSSNLSNWLAWNGHDFSIVAQDPYAPVRSISDQLCKPVLKPAYIVQSVVYHEPSNLFIATGRFRNNDFFFMTSPDLMAWSPAQVLRDEPGNLVPALYPAIVDPRSSARNFDIAGNTPNLYFVKRQRAADGSFVNGQLDVMKAPLRLTPEF